MTDKLNRNPAPSTHLAESTIQASDLEFENGRLVKVRGVRPEYADGYKLIEYVRQLAALVVASPSNRYAGLDPTASISALQEWSDQKYGTPFSVSACHDLIGVLVPCQPPHPVAWVIPGETARDDGFIDAKAWREGEFTKPLYAAHPILSAEQPGQAILPEQG